MPSDFYALLGLTRDATPEEVRRAYYDAARRLHPDVNLEVGATEMFLFVQEAYEVLSDPEKRASYDANLPEEELASNVVAVNTLFSRSVLPLLDEPQLIYALVDIQQVQGEAVPNIPNPPLNLCLALDRSTSMQGERMDMVKAAAIELVRQLRPEDSLSLVVFGDRAEVLSPAGRGVSRGDLETKIRMIHTGGGTEILRGLEASFFEVRRYLSKNRINHIILLTDGRTYGDEQACLGLAERAAALGICITGLGIGGEWNDTFLDALAARTGGRVLYVAKPGDVQHLLQEKFRHLGEVFAEQVILKLVTGGGAMLNYAFCLEPEPAPLLVEETLHIGSLPRGGNLSVLLEFVIDPLPQRVHHLVLGSGSLEMKIPSSPDTLCRQRVILSRPVASVSGSEAPPRRIFDALSQVTLYRMQDRARQDVTAGFPEIASQRLQQLATHLLAQGKRDLAYTVLLEAENIHNTCTLSGEGVKQIKYGTRALLLPSGRTKGGI